MRAVAPKLYQGLASFCSLFCPPSLCYVHAYVVTPIDMLLVTRRRGHTSLLIVGLKVMTLRVLAYQVHLLGLNNKPHPSLFSACNSLLLMYMRVHLIN